MLDSASHASETGKPGRQSGTTLHALSGYFSYPLLILLCIGVVRGGGWYLAAPVYMMIVVPAMDLALGDVKAVYREDEFAGWQAIAAMLCPFGFLLIFCGLLLYAFHVASGLGMTDYLMGIVAFGVVGGVTIAMAHELIHKREWPYKLVGRLGLLSQLLLAFEVPHIHEHHRYANTPRDPVTARRGQTVYHFISRAIVLAFVSTYIIEKARLERKGLRPLSLRNYGVTGPLVTIFALLAVWLVFGGVALVFFVAQAFIGVCFLYAVSYIEHYGMMREDGTRPKFNEPHTWETYARFSSYTVVMLQRHADHHAVATRHYHLLGVDDGQPVLPFGYPVMIAISFIPPLFFRMMDPRLPECYRRPAAPPQVG